MADLIAFLQARVADFSEWVHPSKKSNKPDDDIPMVGKYQANYSQLTPEQIAEEDPELKELYANSRPVSR